MIDVEESMGTKNKEKPKKILNEIQKKVLHLSQKFEETYQDLINELAKQHIYIIREDELNKVQSDYVRTYFQDKVLSVITPVMLHNIKKFPRLTDKSIYLAIKLSSSEGLIDPEYALIEMPSDVIGRFVVLPPAGRNQYIILLDDLDMVIVVASDPFYLVHDSESWKHELASLNLVGKFIRPLPGE